MARRIGRQLVDGPRAGRERGGARPAGKPLYFSRLGRDQVDLLAPGCLIPTFTWSGVAGAPVEVVTRNGTSFAAPIVSFLAALLSAEGMSPWMIKDRLIVSADVDGDLANLVWSSGRLNLTKALSVYRDYIVYADDPTNHPEATTVVVGSLVGKQDEVEICGVTITKRDLRKLAVAPSADKTKPGKWMGWKSVYGSTALGRLDSCPSTDPITGQLDLELDDGTIKTVPLMKVVDFVGSAFNK